MLYINNPNSPAKTYQQIIDIALISGVELKRVYIYLASLGIRGELTRVFDGDQYSEPIKMAVTGKNTFVTKIEICEHCGNLKFDRSMPVSGPVEKKRKSEESLPVPPAFATWELLAAREYRDPQYAFNVSGLNKQMTFDEFSDLFGQYFAKNKVGKWARITPTN